MTEVSRQSVCAICLFPHLCKCQHVRSSESRYDDISAKVRGSGRFTHKSIRTQTERVQYLLMEKIPQSTHFEFLFFETVGGL